MEVLFFENGKVQMTQEGLSMPSMKKAYDNDKNTGKPKFKIFIELLWYIHSKESTYCNIPLIDRISLVNDKHIPSGKSFKSWEELLDKNNEMKDAVEDYIALIKTREDRQYDKLMDDIDNYIDELNNVPIRKKVKTKVDYEDENGEKQVRDGVVEVFNIDERSSAQKAIKELYNLADYLKDRISKQGEVKKRTYIRIFDKVES